MTDYFLIEADGIYTLYDPRSGEHEELNESASDILSAIESGLDRTDLMRSLSDKYAAETSLIGERLDCFIRDFIDRRILTPSHTIRKPVKHMGTTPQLRRIFLEITLQCNLACAHCYADAGRKAAPELSTEAVFDLIDQANSLGVYEFYITGGEPLLRADLFTILGHLEKRRMAVTLLTNGTLLQEKQVRALAKTKNLTLYISLDGACPETHESFRGVSGCFQAALDGIRLARHHDIPVRGNIIVSENNMNELDAIVALLAENGVEWYALDRITRFGRAANRNTTGEAAIEDALLNAYKKYRFNIPEGACPTCGIGRFMCFVSAGGETGLCNLLNHNLSDELSGGSIRTTELKKIWETGTPFVKYRSVRCMKTDCLHHETCTGGCRARALIHHGNIWGADYFECKLHT